DFEPRRDEGRIDAALEAVARVADDLEPAARRGGADRIEQRRFDENLRCRLGAAGRLASDDAAEALHAVLVRDRGDLGIERVFAAVQRRELFAGARETYRQIALQLASIEHMQRPVQIEGQKIRDIDERRDRPESNCFETIAQPARARPVLEAANVATEK